MTCNVILSHKDNSYTARVKEWPDVMVEESSRDDALHRIQEELAEYLAKDVEIVPIEIPLASQKNKPWPEQFGAFKDDPTFDDLQAEIAAYRKEVNATMNWETE